MLRVLIMMVLWAWPIWAAEEKAENFQGYYASLRYDEVNMRNGPGKRFMVEWTYHRRSLPVRVTAVHEQWRRIRDYEGTEGWVHQAMLSSQRTVLVMHRRQALRWKPHDDAPVVAYVAPLVVGFLDECDVDWCRLSFDDTQGYMRQNQFWGADKAESLE